MIRFKTGGVSLFTFTRLATPSVCRLVDLHGNNKLISYCAIIVHHGSLTKFACMGLKKSYKDQTLSVRLFFLFFRLQLIGCVTAVT